MRPLRFSINVTLDGCYDHRVSTADEQVHRRVTALFDEADATLFGRVTYQMMEEAWRPAREWPDWMMPFSRSINAAKKYVVSSTLTEVDWNAELVRGDLATAVRALQEQPGNGLFVAGVQLALGLTELGLIDEYELFVHPTIAGRGPTLFAGLRAPLALTLVEREEFRSGIVALRYVRA